MLHFRTVVKDDDRPRSLGTVCNQHILFACHIALAIQKPHLQSTHQPVKDHCKQIYFEEKTSAASPRVSLGVARLASFTRASVLGTYTSAEHVWMCGMVENSWMNKMNKLFLKTAAATLVSVPSSSNSGLHSWQKQEHLSKGCSVLSMVGRCWGFQQDWGVQVDTGCPLLD